MRKLLILGSALLLAGCAGDIARDGFASVAENTKSRLGARPVWVQSEADAEAARQAARSLLAEPLTPDTAVQVALLNNRGLQAAYAELGLAAADLAQASRLPNPGFAFQRLARGPEIEIERTFTLNALGVLTLPIARAIEERRFDQAKLRAENDILRHAAQVRRAWYSAVAAQQAAEFVAQANDAAAAQAELARRMHQVGNFSLLDYAREQAFHAETAARLARARQMAQAAREKLARLLGLWGDQLAFRLPARLPELPEGVEPGETLEAKAMAERLDIRAARAEIDGLAKSLGLTRATGFLNVLETSYLRNSASGQPRQTGYEISLEIPLFDWGDAKVARAEATYRQAAERLAGIAVDARSEVREAYVGYRTAYDLAKHYRDEVVPLRKRISDEIALRYSGMLLSVFELLADAREQIASVTAAIEASRDFWIAETDLRFVTIADAGAPAPAARFGSGGDE